MKITRIVAYRVEAATARRELPVVGAEVGLPSSIARSWAVETDEA